MSARPVVVVALFVAGSAVIFVSGLAVDEESRFSAFLALLGGFLFGLATGFLFGLATGWELRK